MVTPFDLSILAEVAGILVRVAAQRQQTRGERPPTPEEQAENWILDLGPREGRFAEMYLVEV